ncbi:AMP-binding protein [Pseudobacillus badius]|uniref:AMP-binding protein n=1 Tax=Bacillus badius TaxID=1455 RepID=UPI0007B3AF19|nr:AMP-binding protein [Bacillus badius]KZR59304.1 acyl-CoA synthetase [Bacillus badius]
MASMTSIYAEHAARRPEQLAVKTADREVTWRQWHRLVLQTAGWFHSKRKQNKTVGIFMENGLPFLQLFTGAAAAGWTAVPLHPKWSRDELDKRLRICSPAIIVMADNLADRHFLSKADVFSWEKASEEMQLLPADPVEEAQEDLPFYMGFTSGSTGEPKAFIRSQQSWLASFACSRHDFSLNEHEYVLVPGALIHSHFLYGAVSTLFLGGTVHLLEKFSPAAVLHVMKKETVTVVYLVPTMIEALLRTNTIVEKPFTVISSGAKWEKDSKRRIRMQFPRLKMFEFYGAGELSFVTFLSNNENGEKPDSVGRPCSGVAIQVRRENGEVAAPYESGKIYVKSELVCTGYLTARGIQPLQDGQGWSTVDDIGYLDNEGFLYIKGREKNMILYGGINVFPEEVEAILSLHPKVEAAVVIGMKDPYWGEVIAAVIKGSAAKQELRQLCRERVASYKVPRKWFFQEELPMTAGGKIARAQLREELEKKEDSHV